MAERESARHRRSAVRDDRDDRDYVSEEDEAGRRRFDARGRSVQGEPIALPHRPSAFVRPMLSSRLGAITDRTSTRQLTTRRHGTSGQTKSPLDDKSAQHRSPQRISLLDATSAHVSSLHVTTLLGVTSSIHAAWASGQVRGTYETSHPAAPAHLPGRPCRTSRPSAPSASAHRPRAGGCSSAPSTSRRSASAVATCRSRLRERSAQTFASTPRTCESSAPADPGPSCSRS